LERPPADSPGPSAPKKYFAAANLPASRVECAPVHEGCSFRAEGMRADSGSSEAQHGAYRQNCFSAGGGGTTLQAGSNAYPGGAAQMRTPAHSLGPARILGPGDAVCIGSPRRRGDSATAAAYPPPILPSGPSREEHRKHAKHCEFLQQLTRYNTTNISLYADDPGPRPKFRRLAGPGPSNRIIRSPEGFAGT